MPPYSYACDNNTEPTWVSKIYKWTIRRSLETRRGRVHNKLTLVTIHSQPSRAQTRICLLLCVLDKLAQTLTELIEPACRKIDHIKVLRSCLFNSSIRQENACMRAGQGVAAQGMAIRAGLSKADVQERRALCASARTTNSVTTSLDIAAKPHESAHGLRGPRIRCCSAVMIIHDWTVSEMRHLVPWKMTHPRR